MTLSPESIQELAANARESFIHELKWWLDLDKAKHRAMVVKACLALRNQDGGVLLIGFDDKTGAPGVGSPPEDPRAVFTQDGVQQLVAKYSSVPFEVLVHFAEFEGVAFPVIEVAGGISTPVVASSDLFENESSKFIAVGDVFVRTLTANNRISTAKAGPRDWEPLLTRCFENREADIGRFARRHLTGEGVRELIAALTDASAASAEPGLRERAKVALAEGVEAFKVVAAKRSEIPSEAGYQDIAMVVQADGLGDVANDDFLQRMMARNPRHTGWPAWFDSRGVKNPDDHPHVIDEVWQALVAVEGRYHDLRVDHWRIDPKGIFFLRRGFEDDLAASDKGVEPGTQLDWVLTTRNAAEAIGVAIEFARGLEVPQAETTLGIALAWSNLNGRNLTSWSQAGRSVIPRAAHQASVSSYVEVPLDVAKSAIPDVVVAAMAPLFRAFGGYDLSQAVREVGGETLSRRL